MTSTAEPILGGRFVEAVTYAVELHAGQARKATTIPYLSHLLAVCSLVLEEGGTEDEAIAALLHDGAEDQGGHAILNEIGRRFGAAIATMVDGLSDTLDDPKPPWRARKDQSGLGRAPSGRSRPHAQARRSPLRREMPGRCSG